MPAGLVYLICQILLALVLLAGCRPVYYGAISIAEFEDGEKHALLGKSNLELDHFTLVHNSLI